MAELLPASDETVILPRLRRLLAYWQDKRGDRTMPARADLDPLDFSWLLGSISLADVITEADGARRYRFRLVGTRAVERFGYDPTGTWLHDLPELTYRARVTAAFEAVVQRRIPLVERLDMLIDNRLHDYEMLRLPLGRDGQHVDMLLLAADFFDPTV